MHFIKLSSENVYIYTYFNVHRRLISMVSLTSFFQSLIYTQTHMSYRVLFFVCLRSIHYDDHAILDLYICIYIYLYVMRIEKVDDDRFHTMSIYSRASRRRISKNIYIHTHAPGCDGILIQMITSFTCVILFLSISDSDQ
jgi:hypothetical protein